VATGAPVYAPGVIDVDSVSEGGGGDDGDDTDRDPRSSPATLPLTAPRVCLGRLVGDPDAESGVVVSLERVLV